MMALTAGGTLAFYAYTTYMQKFLVNTTGFDRETASQIIDRRLVRLHVPAAAVGRPVRPDRPQAGDGRRSASRRAADRADLHRAGDGAATRSPPSCWCMAALVIVTGYTSINAVVKAELFPAHIRALGVALPYALANTMFGGTAEYVALWFKDQGMERGFYWYVTAMIGLSLIVYLRMRDTKTAQPDRRGLAIQPQPGGQEEEPGPAAGGKRGGHMRRIARHVVVAAAFAGAWLPASISVASMAIGSGQEAERPAQMVALDAVRRPTEILELSWSARRHDRNRSAGRRGLLQRDHGPDGGSARAR